MKSKLNVIDFSENANVKYLDIMWTPKWPNSYAKYPSLIQMQGF